MVLLRWLGGTAKVQRTILTRHIMDIPSNGKITGSKIVDVDGKRIV